MRSASIAFWTAVIGVVAIVGLSLGGFAIYSRFKRSAKTTAVNNPSNISNDSTLAADAAAIEPKDFSNTNSVSVLLGQESSEDGIRHLWKQSDGRTTIESLDGVPCRYLNRTNKSFGYLYFAIADTFKRGD